MTNLYRLAFISVLQVAIVGFSGCSRAPPKSTTPQIASTAPTASTNPSVDEVEFAKPPVLSDAEVRFGASLVPNSQITYQPDVIALARGADAIKSQSSDGFTWTIDANAPGASQIQPDKILFATGRIVGRVLKLERKGDDLAVTLGPVELTEIFKEAHISYKGTLNPADAIVYLAPPDYPGTYLDRDAAANVASNPATARRRHEGAIQVYRVSRTGILIPLQSPARSTEESPCIAEPPGDFRLMQTAYRGSDREFFARENNCGDRGGNESGGAMRVSDGGAAVVAKQLAEVLLGDFSMLPSLAGGLGASIHYPAKNSALAAVAIDATFKLRIEQPKFTFKLDISNGVKTAAIELKGLGGVDISLVGHANAGASAEVRNVNVALHSPYDISFPIVSPFAATYHQSLTLQTMFTGKQAVLNAQGQYDVGGTITAGIVNGQATGAAPLYVKATKSLADTLSGVSMAVNGLTLAYAGKLIVGVGAFGFVAGPYASINSSVGVTRGSDLQGPLVSYTCRSASLLFWMEYGLGFAIPKWTAAVLSFAIGIFGGKPLPSAYTTPLGSIDIKKFTEGVPPSCATPAA